MADDLTEDDLDLSDDDTGEESGAGDSGGAVPSSPTPVIPGGSGRPQDDAAAVKQILAKKYGSQDQDLQNLQQAQQTANQNRLMAQIGGAVNTAAHGIAGSQAPVNNQPFTQMQAGAEQPVTDLSQQIGLKQTNDKAVRDWLMKKYGVDAASERSQARNSAILQAAKTRADAVTAGKGGKETQDQNKADSELGGKIAVLSGRGINKSYSEAIRRGENIQGLLRQYPDLDKMPEKTVHTLYSEIDGLINAGAPTVAGTVGMTPDSLVSKWQDFRSKSGNDPKGAKLGKFIAPIIPYVGDIVDKSKQNLHDTHMDLVDSYQARLKPEAYTRYTEKIEKKYGKQPVSTPGTNPLPGGGKKPPPSPGSLITLKNGKQFTVGQDGKTLTPYGGAISATW